MLFRLRLLLEKEKKKLLTEYSEADPSWNAPCVTGDALAAVGTPAVVAAAAVAAADAATS